jgi:hypothetical protein
MEGQAPSCPTFRHRSPDETRNAGEGAAGLSSSSLPTCASGQGLAANIRPEHNDADYRSCDRCNKNRAGSHILGIAHERMKFGRCDIREKFKGRVESFGCPDNRYCQDDPAPISGRNSKKECGCRHRDRRRNVNPRIVLATDHARDSNNRMAEAANAPCELEWS